MKTRKHRKPRKFHRHNGRKCTRKHLQHKKRPKRSRKHRRR